MKLAMKILRFIAGAFVVFAGLPGAAHAADVSHAVLLVASERLAGSSFAETVILAAPLPQGGHMGIVINRPTDVRLERLFPEQASAHNVVDPVYAGGPMLSDFLFAVTRTPPKGAGGVVPLMPGLVAVLDATKVDRIIETTPNDARYFVGLMLWKPQQLEEEIRAGAWQVRPPSLDTILRSHAAELWKSLEGTEV
jgi:putative transcriptional regulator